MRKNLLLTIFIVLGILLTACNNNNTISELDQVRDSETVDITDSDVDDEQRKQDEEPNTNETTNMTDGKTDEETKVEEDKEKPAASDINDKDDEKKEPAETENTPNNQAKNKEPASSKKETKPNKKAEQKKVKEKSEETDKVEAKRKAEAEKKAAEQADEDSFNDKSLFDKVIHLTNIEREKAGVPTLQKDAALMKSAQAKSADMKINNSMDHESPEYGGLAGILNHHGVTYSAAGENIASGQASAEAVVEAWMNSSGHRENMLNPNFTHIGIGYDSNYWTQQFITK